MLRFSRVFTPSGSPRKVMPWVANITTYVNANSPLDVTCWAATFGYPIGTVAWTTMVDSQATLAATMNTFLSQDAYLDLIDVAVADGLVTTPGQDLLREVVYGSPGDPPPVGAVAHHGNGACRSLGRRGWLGCGDRPAPRGSDRFADRCADRRLRNNRRHHVDRCRS
jgi:hypothetical protein